MNCYHYITFIILSIIITLHCNGQEKITNMKNRKTFVAGKFYPEEKNALTSELKKYFENAKPNLTSNTIAIIAPHAGYVFSGQVAASAFNQIDVNNDYENVFILASSHVMLFDGVSVYCDGNYETPLGEVKVNTVLANKLVKENSNLLKNYQQPHYTEHSIEVQLPFLQYKFGEKLQIIPIILGTDNPADCKKLAEILKPYFNSKNLFVISSDFSHYPSYTDGQKTDLATSSAILTNNPNELVASIANNKKAKTGGLVTSLCGWTSVLTLMYITENNPNFKYSEIQYLNSGDSPYGDKIKVVGYHAIAISEQRTKGIDNSSFSISEIEKTTLLKLARNTIINYLQNGKDSTIYDFTNNLKTACGAFVTLHKNGKLRGCIGNFSQDTSLYKIIQNMAISSAIHDNRFPQVNLSELDSIDIEISVLTPLKKITSINELKLGKHGIYIKQGKNSGTFLPQVATETGWTKEEFLGHCSQDKTGIGWDGWKNAELFVYEAIVFKE